MNFLKCIKHVDPVNFSEELQGEINVEESCSSEYLMCVYDVPCDRDVKHQTIGILVSLILI